MTWKSSGRTAARYGKDNIAKVLAGDRLLADFCSEFTRLAMFNTDQKFKEVRAQRLPLPTFGPGELASQKLHRVPEPVIQQVRFSVDLSGPAASGSPLDKGQ